MHLALSAGVLMSSPAASLAARNGLIPWKGPPARRAARLLADVDESATERFAALVGAEAGARLGAFVAGVRAWHDHPYVRKPAATTILWQDGSSRLLDYGGSGLPFLLVPSLVNRSYILDLGPGDGLCAWLRGNGVRPLLLDWGPPAATEASFGLDAYAGRRLTAALEASDSLAGGPVPLLGYCMGGLLALAGALSSPGRVRGLALLATPWDFHADGGQWNGPLASVAALASRPGAPPLPVDVVQALFASIQPGLIEAKFRMFAGLDPASERARAFVALEDWVNDGVELAAPVARDCLVGWYRDNRPARGRWTVCGETVEPERLACPAFVALPGRDRVVPPASAAALAALLAEASVVEPRAGHVGMVVGRRARDSLWEPLLAWLKALA